MKTVQFLEWTDLTKEEQEKLLEKQFYKELEWLEQYPFDRCEDELLQSAIDKCVAKMERNQTPWFLSETLRDDPTVNSYLEMISLDAMKTCVFYRWGKDSIDAYPEFFDIK